MTTYRDLPCCSCQAEWLPVFEAAAAKKGIAGLHWYQLIGGAAQSAGTHLTGGAQDLEQMNDQLILLADAMGAPGWPRYTSQGFSVNHFHSVLRGCPHAQQSAKDQVVHASEGRNGLANNGPDYGPAAGRRSARTWQQGIAWAKETILKETPVATPITFVDSALGFAANTWTVKDCDAFIASAKGAGHRGIFVYLSRSSSKCMPKWAILRCIAAGLAVAFVFEDGQNNPLGGAAQAEADAAFVIAQLREIGVSAGTTVIAAFDSRGFSPVAGSAVLAYAQTFAARIKAAGFTPGGYGNRAIVDLACHVIKWLVETWTRSGTSGVHIIQQVNAPIRMVAGCDTDLVVHGFPCMTALVAPVAPPKPNPAADQQLALTKHYAANLGSAYPAGTPRGDFARKIIAAGRGVN